MLAKANRIRSAKDFRSIVRVGRRIPGPLMLAHVVRTDATAPARFGFIVSKAVGNAVVRNRVTRQLRSATRELLMKSAYGFDVVFRVFPPAADTDYSKLVAEVHHQVGKAKVM